MHWEEAGSRQLCSTLRSLSTQNIEHKNSIREALHGGMPGLAAAPPLLRLSLCLLLLPLLLLAEHPIRRLSTWDAVAAVFQNEPWTTREPFIISSALTQQWRVLQVCAFVETL